MKYRIKEYEVLVTRYTNGQWAKEQLEKRYQIEHRLEGFFGRLLGWSEIGSAYDTEQEARNRVQNYISAQGPRFTKKDATYRYIDIN